jgi:hypothetical protein
MESTEPNSNHPGDFPLEDPRPLSQSVLWDLQRRYFEQNGVSAWSEGVVPMYATSNPFIARAYAAVVEAFLDDWAQSHRAGSGLDPAQPIYIVELGAGSGRFAFNFLRRFARRTGPRVVYVMTEYNDDMLDYWQTHPAWQPWIEAGAVDFARCDAAQPSSLALREAGVTLGPGSVANPLVLVANYLFDSIPQDAFYVENGQLYESRVALTSSQPEPNVSDPAVLARSRLVYRRRPVDLPYYGDAGLDALLGEYRAGLDKSGLAFPNVALRCLQFFNALSGGRLLVLTSDKGYHRQEELQGRREPGFEVHGSLSMGVNYHALGRFVGRQGGMALYPASRHLYLATCAFLLGEPPDGYRQSARVYESAIGEFGPEDFFLTQSMLSVPADKPKPEQILALLRLSRWDSHVFRTCFAGLLAAASSASAPFKAEVVEAAARLWDSHYYIGESYDLAYDLGVLLYKLGEYRPAVPYFEHSLAYYGRQANALYNLALCHYMLDEFGAAMRCTTEAVRVDPSFEPAQALQRRLQDDLRKTMRD